MMPRRLLQAPGSAALRGHGDIRFDVVLACFGLTRGVQKSLTSASLLSKSGYVVFR
jgi:hypothetical protein